MTSDYPALRKLERALVIAQAFKPQTKHQITLQLSLIRTLRQLIVDYKRIAGIKNGDDT